MNTPTQTIEEKLDGIKAWLQGEPCEYWGKLYGEPEPRWIEKSPVEPVNKSTIIRRKPQPKLRPWKPEEVPVGAMLRHRCNPPSWYSIISWVEHKEGGWQVGSHDGTQEGRHWFLANICSPHGPEYSTDGIHWKDCGILE